MCCLHPYIVGHPILQPQVREASVLFTDIEGFTTIAEQLSPEQVITLLNEYFHVVSEPIQRYHGVVTQFQGDGMLVTFNLPLSNPDHATSAVRAALGVQETLKSRRFNRGLQLRTRIGVNTGQIVGGTVGDGDRLGYTVHGDAVNLAARLEQLNKQFGTDVLVSARTAELARSNVHFTSLGEVTMRGRQQPVTVFTPADLSTARTIHQT